MHVAARGEVVAVIGAMAPARTTLCRAISGVHRTPAGSISFDDKPLFEILCASSCRIGHRACAEGRHVFAPFRWRTIFLVGAWSVKRSATPDGSQIEWTYDAFPI